MREWKVSKQFIVLQIFLVFMFVVLGIVFTTVAYIILKSNQLTDLMKVIYIVPCAAPFILIWLFLTMPVRIILNKNIITFRGLISEKRIKITDIISLKRGIMKTKKGIIVYALWRYVDNVMKFVEYIKNRNEKIKFDKNMWYLKKNATDYTGFSTRWCVPGGIIILSFLFFMNANSMDMINIVSVILKIISILFFLTAGAILTLNLIEKEQ